MNNKQTLQALNNLMKSASFKDLKETYLSYEFVERTFNENKRPWGCVELDEKDIIDNMMSNFQNIYSFIRRMRDAAEFIEENIMPEEL